MKICAICGRIYNKKVLCIPRIPWENILQEECNPWENTQQEEIIIKKQDRNMILDIDNILVSSDIITEQFCCDLDMPVIVGQYGKDEITVKTLGELLPESFGPESL